MSGHPVQDNAHPGLVELVDEVHEVVGGAEAAGGGKVAGALVAPGVVQGVLGEGHELHMGEAHLLHVGDQVVGNPPVGEELPVSGPPPGAQVDFIDIQRTVINRVFLPIVQPGLVVPLVGPQLIELGGGARPGLGVEGIGIGLQKGPAVFGADGILIDVVAIQTGDKALPQSPADGREGIGLLLPAVEVSHHGDLCGVGRPDAEGVAPLAVPLLGMGTHELPGADGLAVGVRPDDLIHGGGFICAIHGQRLISLVILSKCPWGTPSKLVNNANWPKI